MAREPSITQVYKPIRRELLQVRNKIRSAVRAKDPVVDGIVGHIFRTNGKLLRPALTIFAGRAAMKDSKASTPEKLVQLATAVELIHNASLVHDDILDGATSRREVRTLNAAYNNHIAVLAGDVIFTEAFFLMTRHLDRDVIEPLTRVTAGMCHAEIINEVQGDERMDFDTYLEIIRLKTAALMSTATEAGARVVGAPDALIEAMAEFGMNMGIAYQLIDDYVDGETATVEGFSLDLALTSIERAREALSLVEPSVYSSKLTDMLTLVAGMARTHDMSTVPTLGAAR